MKLYAITRAARGGRYARKGDDERLIVELYVKNNHVATVEHEADTTSLQSHEAVTAYAYNKGNSENMGDVREVSMTRET